MAGINSDTVYVGNLPFNFTLRQAYLMFDRYGEIIDARIKASSTRSYAFIQFKDYRDASDAVYFENGSMYGGKHILVEFARSSRGNGSISTTHAPRDSYTGKSYHAEYQVLVTGLPSTANAIELEEHMEQAGKVCFSEVRHQRTETIGIVEFEDKEIMEFAAKMLHCSEFINFYSRSCIDVKQYSSEDWPSPRSQSRSRSPSPSRTRSRRQTRSPSRSPRQTHNRSRSQTQTRSRSRSRSHSQTRSRTRSQTRSRTAAGAAAGPAPTAAVMIGAEAGLPGLLNKDQALL